MFYRDRWEDEYEERTDEISLNPDLLHRPIAEIFSTLVHEMAHQWQYEFGKPSRNGYHNKQWADKMESLGLMPSDDGKPGGRRTGQGMTHYIIEGGAFARAFDAMPEDCILPWRSGATQKPKPKTESKIRYTCDECGQNAWGKPGLLLSCNACEGNPAMT